MVEVVVLPGVERRDLAGNLVSDVDVLQAAIDRGITDVVIVGRHRDGSRYVASSGRDIDRTVGQIMGAVAFLTHGTFAQGIVETTPEPT